jgi:predicted ArsR family transcriptional regulator
MSVKRAGDLQTTRRQILEVLKRRGQATLRELVQEIGLSPVTLRAHIMVLERDGYVRAKERRGPIGRPFYVYYLTSKAQNLFPQAYDFLCSLTFEALKATANDEVVGLFLRNMARAWADLYKDRLQGKNLEERVAEAARIRDEEGAMASWQKVDGGYVIRLQHCPLYCVARDHRETCSVELLSLQEMVGAPLERVEWLQEGGSGCTYFVAAPQEVAAG